MTDDSTLEAVAEVGDLNADTDRSTGFNAPDRQSEL